MKKTFKNMKKLYKNIQEISLKTGKKENMKKMKRLRKAYKKQL